jgi:hypothetical protein
MNGQPPSPEQQRGSLTWLWIVLAIVGGLFILCIVGGAVMFLGTRSAVTAPPTFTGAPAAVPLADGGDFLVDDEDMKPAPSDFKPEECKKLCALAEKCKVPGSEGGAECEQWCAGDMLGDSHEFFYCLRAAKDCKTAEQCGEAE